MDDPRAAILERLWAIFLRPWPDEPVYHKLDKKYNRTACGRWFSMYTPMFPMKHAVKFGRACGSCWPEVPAEFRGPVR